MKCVLKNKNYNTYLKYIKRLRLKRYILNIDEATLYTKTEANKMIKKFKHPENWEVIKISVTELKKNDLLNY